VAEGKWRGIEDFVERHPPPWRREEDLMAPFPRQGPWPYETRRPDERYALDVLERLVEGLPGFEIATTPALGKVEFIVVDEVRGTCLTYGITEGYISHERAGATSAWPRMIEQIELNIGRFRIVTGTEVDRG
jgi:hypothetical protein